MERVQCILERQGARVVFSLVLILFGLALAVGLRTQDRLRYLDEEHYHRLAESLLSGTGYVGPQLQPTAFRPPGYPFFLSVVYRVWHRPLAAKVANALALACSAWLLSVLVAQVVPEGRAFAPLLLLMLAPVSIYATSTLYPQTLGTLILLAALFFLIRSQNSATAAIVSGVLWGFLILTIPSFLLILPLIVAFLFFLNSSIPARACRQAALFLCFAVLVVSPWTIRNAFLYNRFIPVSTNSGVNLLLGNSENTGPNSGVNVDISHYRYETRGLDEAETDAHLRRRSFEWVLNHPSNAVILYFCKVVNYFNFRNELATASEASRFKDAVLFLTYYPLLALAIIRCALWRRFNFSATECLFFFLYFGNAFLSAIFFTRIRFRIPFDVLLVAIAAILVGHLLTMWRNRWAEPSSPPD